MEECEFGNLALFANEQWINIQPWYDVIRGEPDGGLFSRGNPMVRSVHPYHRDFVIDVHGEVSVARDRWSWINDVPNAMWPQWIALPEGERTRLVNLSMADLMGRRWEPILATHTYHGTQY